MGYGISQKNLFITPREAQKFLNSIQPAERKYRVLLLLVANGVRGGEAVRLNVKNFIKNDFTQFYIKNTKVGIYVCADCKKKVRGKNNLSNFAGCQFEYKPREDLKVVPSWVGAEIKDYIDYAYTWNQIKDGYLFPTNRPGKYCHMHYRSFIAWFAHKRSVLKMTDVAGWKPALPRDRARGIETYPQYRMSIYSFRRLMATEDAIKGVSQQFTAARMGHLDVRTTSKYVERQRIYDMLPEIVEKNAIKFMNDNQRMLTEFGLQNPLTR